MISLYILSQDINSSFFPSC